MALVRSGGGSEKVTIDGVPVKERINLKTILAKEEKVTTPGVVTKAFILNNKLYICVSNKLYVFNKDSNSFTFLVNAPTKYIFCNQKSIFCGKVTYSPQSNFAYQKMFLYEYNFEKNAFTEIQKKEYMSNKSQGTFLFYGYGNTKGGCLIGIATDMNTRVSYKIGDVFAYPAKINGNIVTLPQDANSSLKVRCIEHNSKSYLNTGICSNDNGNYQFTMYENAVRKQYTATSEFINTYKDGSLASINGRLWMYGTNKDGMTKRIEWTGSTYTNEEIVVEKSENFNINNTTPIEFENEILFIGENSVFLLGKNYKKI